MNIDDLKAKVYPGESCSIRNCKTKTIYKGTHIVNGAYLCLKHFKDLEESLDLELELDWTPYYIDRAKDIKIGSTYKSYGKKFTITRIDVDKGLVKYEFKKRFKKYSSRFGIGSFMHNEMIELEKK